jgi:hypothetical protein
VVELGVVELGVLELGVLELGVVELGVLEDGVELGVLEDGVELGVALGVDVGVALGVAFGVVLGVDVGVALGVAFGVVLGVALGAVLGVAFGVALGVAFGAEGEEGAEGVDFGADGALGAEGATLDPPATAANTLGRTRGNGGGMGLPPKRNVLSLIGFSTVTCDAGLVPENRSRPAEAPREAPGLAAASTLGWVSDRTGTGLCLGSAFGAVAFGNVAPPPKLN